MNYCQLFTPPQIALLYDWFEAIEELFIYLEFPHSGGSGFSYQVSSLEDLKLLVSKQTHPEIEIFIFKSKMLSEDELDERLELPWVYSNRDKVLYIAVKMNLNYHEEYQNQKYKEAIITWFEQTKE